MLTETFETRLRHVWYEKCIQNFSWKTWREGTTRESYSNIKMVHKEIGCQGVEWIQMIQDRSSCLLLWT